ncbi:DUF1190 domain-containing protein [Enterovirga rhinocerotis]|uniref:Uncharacterized protein YgiB involved in biofilm formation n=1 Tax=Enterovirga rhinocerotis TaxID=1339210 RepID=A0A4R7BNG9_9HYPH|nr:DUF1190 domain-containing protein [Enterovirga rhinocerotis]TDR85486.1 uncharacterized protein YgiB involved in biofilm formation [Enterovirga rhinocerotis]
MKRSTQIGLGAVGIILVASGWSYFGGEDDQLVYTDAASCRADGRMSEAQCEQRFREARTAQARDAKRFPSQSSCETEFGQGRCDTIQVNGTPMWVPALAGIMLARRLAAGGGAAEPLFAPTRQACPPGGTAPECQPARSGTGSSGSGGGYAGRRAYSTTSGGTVTAGTGTTKVSVASRGGFGSTGRGGGYSSGS